MLQQSLGSLIQEGIAEGHRFALSSDLWRCAVPTQARGDVLLTLRPIKKPEDDAERERAKKTAVWLVDTLKQLAPELRIEVRYHQLTNAYGLYLSASYVQMLKGAELCQLKKRLKPCFGHSMRDFTFEEAQCFKGVENRRDFLSSMERAMILKQRLGMIRAPKGGLKTPGDGHGGRSVGENRAVVETLRAMHLINGILPLHESEKLRFLQTNWVYAFFEEQPLEQIKVGAIFGGNGPPNGWTNFKIL